MASKQELGAFLRAHREWLAPSDVGLAGGSRRRTPGLRREEVAALSGVGLAWYTWLEQGRVDTSRQVLDAVSRALRLDRDSHGHVLALAGLRPVVDQDVDLSAVLTPLVDAWPGPAAAVDRRFDLVTANPAYLDLWRLPERNLVLLLTDPAVRDRVPGWEPLAQDVFRQFRMHADRHPDDPRTRDLLARFAARRPELACWWECRSVRAFRTTTTSVDGTPWTFSLLRPGEDPEAGVLLLSAAGPR
ncbi:helix-turn-helix domain-containing protein [Umezawaea sp.]|uniref:helix-turn-helix domain-containing protein n=1 Tax=Umezawaea sp. TaxID=1955258 RepID=UPI002ED1C227